MRDGSRGVCHVEKGVAAEDEVRTRDIQIKNLVLYLLSYLRTSYPSGCKQYIGLTFRPAKHRSEILQFYCRLIPEGLSIANISRVASSFLAIKCTTRSLAASSDPMPLSAG